MELILSPENMTKLDNAVTECVNSLIRASAEKDFRKDVLDRMKEEISIEASDFNALVKERHEESLSEKIAKLEGVIEMNDKLNEHRRKQKTKYTAVDDAEAEDDGA